MSSDSATVQEIARVLQQRNGARRLAVTRERLRRWMRSKDPESRGAVYCLIMDPFGCESIQPALDQDEAFAFVKEYYRMCLVEDPKGAWVHSRYEAGWDIAKYLKARLNTKEKIAASEAQTLVSLLREVYEAGDEQLRRCIDVAILEHVVHLRGAAELFRDWMANPLLAKALRVAEQSNIES